MSQTYDIVQTTFLLSLAANGASSIAGTQDQLQGYLEAYLNGGTDPIGQPFGGFFPQMNPSLAGGDWTVVWGPRVFSVLPNAQRFATNAMYVAHSAALSTHVVAIAATNPKSIYDWVVEDGDVLAAYQARWPFSVPFRAHAHLPLPGWIPAVSAATAIGVSHLLSEPAMIDPENGSLQTFLTHAAAPDATLIVCGHSLAGALSPTTALYLCPDPARSGWKAVHVLPTAGASPGNDGFAKRFDAAFPPTPAGVNAPYGTWNVDYANARDVVPHAWNQLDEVIGAPDASGNYPSIYGVLNAGLGKKITGAINFARTLAFDGHYMNVSQTKFTADWGHWVWTQNPDGSWQYPPAWQPMPTYTDATPAAADDLAALIEATHIDQYMNFFGVAAPPRMAIDQASATAAETRRRAIVAAAQAEIQAAE